MDFPLPLSKENRCHRPKTIINTCLLESGFFDITAVETLKFSHQPRHSMQFPNLHLEWYFIHCLYQLCSSDQIPLHGRKTRTFSYVIILQVTICKATSTGIFVLFFRTGRHLFLNNNNYLPYHKQELYFIIQSNAGGILKREKCVCDFEHRAQQW